MQMSRLCEERFLRLRAKRGKAIQALTLLSMELRNSLACRGLSFCSGRLICIYATKPSQMKINLDKQFMKFVVSLIVIKIKLRGRVIISYRG